MTGMVGFGPCATAMGVGMVTDAHSGPRSRVRVLAGAYGYGGGPDVGAYSRFVTFLKDTAWIFALCLLPVMVLDEPAHQESTEKPLRDRLS